ncbi:helix-turn-helix domain-containing protein [Subtercola endophyticus]|uniref:helix-turn-helix domain-containing protein n=1 Tax=Subtercola endophyticus TaxID=2895559 RepID=UPI0036F32836
MNYSDEGSGKRTPDQDPNSVVSGDATGWLTSAEAAELYGCSARAIQKACAAGRLSARKTGHDWWIARTDFDDYRFRRSEHDRHDGDRGAREARGEGSGRG